MNLLFLFLTYLTVFDCTSYDCKNGSKSQSLGENELRDLCLVGLEGISQSSTDNDSGFEVLGTFSLCEKYYEKHKYCKVQGQESFIDKLPYF